MPISKADYDAMLARCEAGRKKAPWAKKDRPATTELPRAEPERIIQHEPLGKTESKDKAPKRFRVRIISMRRRLLDIDNLYGGSKWLVDCCRYAGFIPEDSPEAIDLQIKQQKVQWGDDEMTEITIEEV